ncbi:MAG: homoserine O-succinyltransferase, partial [Hyphomicrobiales bacterium]|nr:homoserine O-succinyltransferase [Hyphomicrobiales bacterium]
RESNFAREPYWDAFVRLVSWAKKNTVSTIWSCLAAHAAAFQLDGVERRALSQKKFGVFKCDRVDGHAMMRTMPATIEIPHSRWNELSETDLLNAGYTVLTSSREAGVDMFAKRADSLFLFMQGHPEYDAHSLLLEYRRDVGRYLCGSRNDYPGLPSNYFSEEAVAALRVFEATALHDRSEGLLTQFPTALAAKSLTSRWRPHAKAVFAAWLAEIENAQSRRRP